MRSSCSSILICIIFYITYIYVCVYNTIIFRRIIPPPFTCHPYKTSLLSEIRVLSDILSASVRFIFKITFLYHRCFIPEAHTRAISSNNSVIKVYSRFSFGFLLFTAFSRELIAFDKLDLTLSNRVNNEQAVIISIRSVSRGERVLSVGGWIAARGNSSVRHFLPERLEQQKIGFLQLHFA